MKTVFYPAPMSYNREWLVFLFMHYAISDCDESFGQKFLIQPSNSEMVRLEGCKASGSKSSLELAILYDTVVKSGDRGRWESTSSPWAG